MKKCFVGEIKLQIMYSKILEKIVNLRRRSSLNMFVKGHFIPKIETNYSEILKKIILDKAKKIINDNLLCNILFYTELN